MNPQTLPIPAPAGRRFATPPVALVTKVNTLLVALNEELGIHVYAETPDQLAEQLATEVDFIHRSYVVADPGTLAEDAIRLRRRWEAALAVSLDEVLTLPLGTRVAGLAPIGIRWGATVTRRANGTRYLRPDAGCPVGEFAPTAVYINGVRREVA